MGEFIEHVGFCAIYLKICTHFTSTTALFPSMRKFHHQIFQWHSKLRSSFTVSLEEPRTCWEISVFDKQSVESLKTRDCSVLSLWSSRLQPFNYCNFIHLIFRTTSMQVISIIYILASIQEYEWILIRRRFYRKAFLWRSSRGLDLKPTFTTLDAGPEGFQPSQRMTTSLAKISPKPSMTPLTKGRNKLTAREEKSAVTRVRVESDESKMARDTDTGAGAGAGCS